MSQIENFEAMLARGQDSEMLRYTLGNAYWQAKDYERAEEHLRQALDMKPDYSAAWKVLGRVLADAGKPQDAIAAFTDGLAAAEKNGDKQTAKEMTVFMRRAQKTLDAAADNS
ncbi:MAG: tetratricopeptide repeat protein [Gammaproteobacteria bacterium]|nr:tetratricopeptide repeat protein [Gammaproteobacteria bacterium]